MVLMDVLMGFNSLLLMLVLWVVREYWRAHKEQHGQIMDSLGRLGEVYATKSSLERAHKRLDGLEREHSGHEARLTRLETSIGMGASVLHPGSRLPERGAE